MVTFLEKIKKFNEKRKTKRILATAAKGFRKRQQLKLQKIKLEEMGEREKSIAQFREAQARRTRAEAKILEGKARQQKARRKIAGPIAGPIAQASRAAAAGFGQTQPVQIGLSKKTIAARKKKPKGPTPGLGRFRVL